MHCPSRERRSKDINQKWIKTTGREWIADRFQPAKSAKLLEWRLVYKKKEKNESLEVELKVMSFR